MTMLEMRESRTEVPASTPVALLERPKKLAVDAIDEIVATGIFPEKWIGTVVSISSRGTTIRPPERISAQSKVLTVKQEGPKGVL